MKSNAYEFMSHKDLEERGLKRILVGVSLFKTKGCEIITEVSHDKPSYDDNRDYSDYIGQSVVTCVVPIERVTDT